MTNAAGIRWAVDEDGIAVLTLDEPGRPANTVNAAHRASLAAAVDWLESRSAQLRGAVITSAKDTFVLGPDPQEVMAAQPGAAAALTASGNELASLIRRLEVLPVPVVAAVNGTALGGGLALALGCHHRVAANVPGAVIGMPEVRLGLLPGGGGLTRAVRLLGIERALAEVLLEGRLRTPAQALELGLVDELTSAPQELVPRAKAWIGAHPAGCVQPWDVPGYRVAGLAGGGHAPAVDLPALPARLRARLGGAPAPAPRAILAAAVEGAQVGIETAALVETRYLVSLMTGQIAKNLTKIYAVDLPALARGGGTGPPGRGPAELAGVWEGEHWPAISPVDGRELRWLGAGGDHVGSAENAAAFACRVLGAYLGEAVAAVAAGAEPATVEQAAAQAGYRLPPLRLADEITLPLAGTLTREWADAPGHGARAGGLHPAGALDRMVGEFGRAGRAAGGGFYCYPEQGGRAAIWPGMRGAFESGSASIGLAEVAGRLLLAPAEAALRCLEEGVVASAAQADVMSVFGAGFPAWTGGAVHYARQRHGRGAGPSAGADGPA